jgi:hypothetical protein
MFVKLWHQSHPVFPDDPRRFVAVFVIFESMIHRNSCHSNIHARLQRIAFRIEPQNRTMLCDSVAQQNDINVVVKVLLFLTRWFLSLQFAGQTSADTFAASGCLRKSRMTAPWTMVLYLNHEYEGLRNTLAKRVTCGRLVKCGAA